jgi:hypothetical protein
MMRMETNRFKVFRHLNEWFEEKRMYHRRDGKIWKEFDDLMSATRYAVMCLRFAARVQRANKRFAEDFSAPYDSYNDKNYNPLGHKYVDELLMGKQ